MRLWQGLMWVARINACRNYTFFSKKNAFFRDF
jgi:hypothetical protein